MKEKIILRGHHLELTDALKAHVTEKVEKLFRHEPRIIRIRVELEHDRMKNNESMFIASGHVEIGGPDLVASDTSADMYGSVDEMVQKLDRMLRNRARLQRHKRNHPHNVEIAADLPKVEVK